jgi:UDP-N-acetylglucosamine acyltransferase
MPAAQIHPTAILEGDVRIGDDCVIGPFCVIRGSVSIGAGTRLLGNVYLQGPLTLGERNKVYPFCSLGFSPQDLKWDPNTPGAGLVVGSGNTFREGVTIHRATSHETPTTIGDNNYWMANTHAGHDCRIGSNCIFANGTLFAGHVQVGDRVITGGNVTVHQFCRVGFGAMLSGTMGMSMDLPPRFMLTGGNIAGSLNLIGMRRSGMSREQIDTVRWVHRTLYRAGISPRAALEDLRERNADPLVREYIDFIESSKRGICHYTPKAIRGSRPYDQMQSLADGAAGEDEGAEERA